MKKNNRGGSVLAFTLIVMTIILIIALGIARTTVTQMRNAGATGKSTMAFQIADSGAEIVLKKINKDGYKTVVDLDINGNMDCSNGVLSETGKDYKIIAKKSDGSEITSCVSTNSISKIKSIGTYGNTSRAVEVKVCGSTWTGGVWNGLQNDYIYGVITFDWSPSYANLEGVGPISQIVAKMSPGTDFTFRSQYSIASFIGLNGLPLIFPGLNSNFEYTMVAQIPLKVISNQQTGSVYTIVSNTRTGGGLYIYYDSSVNVNNSTGSGFDDGTPAASGIIEPNKTVTIIYDPSTNKALVSIGFKLKIQSVNMTYINPPFGITTLNLAGAPYTYNNDNPAEFFSGRPGEGSFSSYTVNPGSDILLQDDASSVFKDDCI